MVLARCPVLCCWHACGQAPWRPSKQQGFLLEVIPLPEGQAVKLFHAHPKHFLELLGRQVPLQSRPVHIFGQFHTNSVCDNEGVIRIDLVFSRAPAGIRVCSTRGQIGIPVVQAA